jgi:hypothetical protein
MLYHVDWQTAPDILKDSSAFIISIKQSNNTLLGQIYPGNEDTLSFKTSVTDYKSQRHNNP